ncbi:FecR family protein [Sphingobium sp. CR28]|uniref:FecR family protein n=1 Tax=Sphingobium sp. CR28 TaxID=3400272 RepID=UPI003FEF860C
MNQRDTAQAINERATEWVARIDAAPLSEADRTELEAWIALDDRHNGAFFRATVAWRMLDRASALVTPLPATALSQAHSGQQDEEEESEAYAEPARLIGRRGMLWGGGAIAASLVVAGFGWRTLAVRPELIETAIGETRRVPLADGSDATVNTATALEVDFSPATRNVRLQKGEAWFEVAKDVNRPFVVAAGEVRVRAVGTAFAVRRLDHGSEVQVTEGKVEVWVTGREESRRLVTAGARTFVENFGGPQAPIADASGIDRKLSWRDGALNFEGDTLAAAITEFNRYNHVKLAVDPALADETIIGRFRTNEPEAFARAASAMLGARVEQGPDIIRIARQ